MRDSGAVMNRGSRGADEGSERDLGAASANGGAGGRKMDAKMTGGELMNVKKELEMFSAK